MRPLKDSGVKLPTGQVERVFCAVDVMNIWYSGRAQFGPGVRVNYGRLKDLVRNHKLGNYPRELKLVAYTITASAKQEDDGSVTHHDQPRNAKFLETLQKAGYEIKNRNLYMEKGLKKPFASDWDVGIAIDAINNVNGYDTFCLVSGDGDYALLIEDLKARNKYVEVITFEDTASRILYASADRVIHITENEIFRQDPYGGESNPQKSR
jgi:uncharacterized LabA/DUF88 family protein